MLAAAPAFSQVEKYLNLAESGNPDAQYNLALTYCNNGQTSNAIKWLNQAVSNHQPDAARLLGYLHYNSEKYSDAIAALSKTASSDTEAQTLLGYMYEKGLGVSPNPEEAFLAYKRATDKGATLAQVYVGLCYQNGNGTAKDLALAIEYFKKAELKGDASALCNLGYLYQTGTGVTQNHSKAFDYYQKAADKGLPRALNNLGVCYASAIGTNYDFYTAFQYFKRAAALGDQDAMFNLAECYYYGKGTETDHEEATKYYEKAAENGRGHIVANRKLGLCYLNGEGTDADTLNAKYYLQQAARRGDTPAFVALSQLNPAWSQECEVAYNNALSGKSNESGKDFVARGRDYENQGNYGKAYEQYSRAAAENYGDGYYYMARCLFKGSGVEKNNDEAIKTIDKALACASDWRYYDLKGEIYLEKNDANMARQLCEEAKRRANNDNVSYTDVSPLYKSIYGKSQVDDLSQVAAAPQKSNVFALIIANEKYQHVPEVPFAQNDGETFRQYCEKVIGVKPSNIIAAKNITYANFASNINKFCNLLTSTSNATAIVYYAGHGYAGYLVPTDCPSMADTATACFRLDRLYQQLEKCNNAQNIVFIDACFSGRQRSGGMIKEGERALPNTGRRAGTLQGNMVVFSASQGDQTANQYAQEKHGMFTYFILNKLKETNGNVSLGELVEYVKDNVSLTCRKINNQEQQPSENCSPAVRDSWKNWKLK